MLKIYPRAIESAVRAFKDHKAAYRVSGAGFSVLDWKRPGTIQYWVRMVFDHERDNTMAVYITGDLGEAVVYPTCPASLEDMANCFTSREPGGPIDINETYFLEKVKTGNHLFEWGMDEFKEDLREEFVRRFGKDEDQHELNEFFEEYCDGYLPNVVIDNGVHITDSFARDALESIFPDWNEWIYSCGKRVSNFVVFWLVAMRLAYEQLNEHGERKANDGEEQQA